MKYEINPLSVSAISPTDTMTITTMKADYTFERFDSVVMHLDTPNEYHSKPDGVIELKVTVITDSEKRMKAEYTMTIECIGIHDFGVIDLDGGKIDNESISEDDRSEIADKLAHDYISNREFRDSVIEKVDEVLSKKFFKKKK